MQLTRYTDYSLRVLIYLSLNRDRSSTISEIADFYKISRNHLVKVVHNLSLKKYINSSRGKGGGLKFAHPPGDIVVGDVVRDTEPNFHIAECFNPVHDDCNVETICQLKNILNIAADNFLHTLDGYTVADIISDTTSTEAQVELDPAIRRLLEAATEKAT
ncbi:MAG: Rrf2 family transcriptional regulator [Gammaproteobacteria bacterium]|nr:Rrf2 family transcriptional regulator [Gammaproteobacteria bacterium]